jgi:hypothetical protein
MTNDANGRTLLLTLPCAGEVNNLLFITRLGKDDPWIRCRLSNELIALCFLGWAELITLEHGETFLELPGEGGNVDEKRLADLQKYCNELTAIFITIITRSRQNAKIRKIYSNDWLVFDANVPCPANARKQTGQIPRTFHDTVPPPSLVVS